MKKLLFLLVFIPLVSFGQVRENMLPQIVEALNKESPITDPRTGVTMAGAMSYSNTLVYLYEVPDEWFPPDDMKKTLIDNFQTAKIADVYIKAKINVDFNYYKGSKLIKRISIKNNEFKNTYDNNGDLIETRTLINELGEYIAFKNHHKAKGVNIKIKHPKSFEKREGNRPNVVVKFVHKTKNINYNMVIGKLPAYSSRNETIDNLFQEDSDIFAKQLAEGLDGNFISSRYTQIDNYPAIESILQKETEIITGETIISNIVMWTIFYEDRVISLTGGSVNEDFEVSKLILASITNSIILEDQYDSSGSSRVYFNDNFDEFVDKFYRELNYYGINKVRPNNISIKLMPLDEFKDTSHFHGFSLGFNNDNVVNIVLNERSWSEFSKAQKHYLIFHELSHDILNLDDLDSSLNEKKIMYPLIDSFKDLTMDDFIENFHNLLYDYSISF